MNRYTYRRKFNRDSLTWGHEYFVVLAHELPEPYAGYDLFTITKL